MKKHHPLFRKLALTITIGAFLAGCAAGGGQAQVSGSNLSTDSLALASADAGTIRQSARDLGESVAQWQLAHLDNYD